MSRDQQFHDLFDGDPEFEIYHQDYTEGAEWTHITRSGFVIPAILLLFTVVVYHTLFLLDYDVLPLRQLLWNVIVYLTPTRLIDLVESYQSPLRIPNPATKHIPRTHAAKSEAMRRILGLDAAGGIIESVSQAGRRRLSSIAGTSVAAAGTNGRPAGLGNWDNSCYQNSVLQGLASLDSLSDYLANPGLEKAADEFTEKPDLRMADALRGLIATLNDPENNGKRIWTPATLKNMSSWQQQDAQEYFSKVLEEIDKEIGKVAGIMRKSQALEVQDCSLKKARSADVPKMSHCRNPLDGLIAQRVGCTSCGFSEGLSMIPFNCLTVPLGRAWEYDVSECLDEYTKLEQIEGVECGRCTLLKSQHLLSLLKERVKEEPEDSLMKANTSARLAAVEEALEEDDYEEKTIVNKCKIPPKSRVSSTKSRQAVIARPPRSLVIHVNRSQFDEMTGELKKNYAEVRFPKVLDLGPWCLGSSGAAQDVVTEQWLLDPAQPMIASSQRRSRIRGPLYELRAVVTHYGRHENGHYICYKKHPAEVSDEKGVVAQQWWRLSDDEVMKVSEENVLGQGGVFMLFFDCVDPATTVVQGPATLEVDLNAASVVSDLVAAATAIALPNSDDTELLEYQDQDQDQEVPLIDIPATNSSSTAPTISEIDDEETDTNDEEPYEPTKPIIVPSYINATKKRHADDEVAAAGQKEAISPSLLMV